MTTRNPSRPLMTLRARDARRRRITSVAFAGCAALVLAHIADLCADPLSPQTVLERFLDTSARRLPVAYRAVRRLEASSARMTGTGWVEALTEFDPQTGLRVRVLAEGGAGRIRGALKGVLDAERDATLPGKYRNVALTIDNYTFQAGAAEATGEVALRVTPRRRDPALVDGTIFISVADAELVRVEGRLAKSPSFWTRSIDLVRYYARRAGQNVPVEVQSLADVKIIGPVQFVMRYEYESVNGQTAGDAVPLVLLAALASQP